MSCPVRFSRQVGWKPRSGNVGQQQVRSGDRAIQVRGVDDVRDQVCRRQRSTSVKRFASSGPGQTDIQPSREHAARVSRALTVAHEHQPPRAVCPPQGRHPDLAFSGGQTPAASAAGGAGRVCPINC